mmetsp:Transcript_11410/g.21647  ORF Transcript_11410/g.21647 Transcript_11410/m.21647 type:complete len:223 (-) Transcript_11410:2020-2688(-)
MYIQHLVKFWLENNCHLLSQRTHGASVHAQNPTPQASHLDLLEVITTQHHHTHSFRPLTNAACIIALVVGRNVPILSWDECLSSSLLCTRCDFRDGDRAGDPKRTCCCTDASAAAGTRREPELCLPRAGTTKLGRFSPATLADQERCRGTADVGRLAPTIVPSRCEVDAEPGLLPITPVGVLREALAEEGRRLAVSEVLDVDLCKGVPPRGENDVGGGAAGA